MGFGYEFQGGYMPQNYGSFQQKNNYPGYAQNNSSPWIYVPTAKDVQNVQIQPGQKAWVMVQNDCIFALKSADNMGIVSTDFYKFEKIEDAASNSEYVTRKEFEEFIKTLRGGIDE